MKAILEQTFKAYASDCFPGGEESKDVKPDYFKLIDLTEIRNAAKQAEADKITTLVMPKVDKDQFDYFLNRKMFS